MVFYFYKKTVLWHGEHGAQSNLSFGPSYLVFNLKDMLCHGCMQEQIV